MQIIMLQTRYGSEDGFVVRRFFKNYQYKISDSLAAYFISLGLAKSLTNMENTMSNNRSRGLERVTAPSSEPVTLAEAKSYLRIDSPDEDSLVSDLIIAARVNAEQWLKSSIISQTWKLLYNDYVEKIIRLEMLPVVGIVSVIVTNSDSSSYTVPADSYYLNAAKTSLIFDSCIEGALIEITYNTGYGSAAQVPKPIKYGILSHIAAMYDERGLIGQVNLPDQVSALYHPFREFLL